MKKAMVWVLIALLLMGGVPALAGNETEDDIEIKIETPLAGIIKGNQLARVIVYLKNNGDAFFGEIELKRAPFENHSVEQEVFLRKEISLAQGEEKAVPLDVMGHVLNNSLAISLSQGGKQMVTQLIPGLNQVKDRQGEWVVGVLSDHSNAYHFLSLLQSRVQRNFFVQSLEVKDIPDEYWILNSIDILAIGNLPQGLTVQQIDAIKKWVQSGGILLVSGGNSLENTKKAFGDLIPIPSVEIETRDISRDLNQWTQLEPPAITAETVASIPSLFASFAQGEGRVIVAAYDVAKEPLASWQGNRELWLQVVNKFNLVETMYAKERKMDRDWELYELSYMIPNVKAPNVLVIAAVWLLYILIASPILYFILKKKDRREWAWGIIPALSILFTAGVYFAGKFLVAKQDASHTVSSIAVIHDHLAELKNTTSFLMINGGDYKVQKELNAVYVPDQVNRRNEMGMVKLGEDGVIKFQDVPYLSMRHASALALREDVGSFGHELTIEGNKLKGWIQNGTAFDLKQVTLYLGLQEFKLGDLKKGEKVPLDHELKRIYMPEPNATHRGETPSLNDRLQDMSRKMGGVPNNTVLPFTITGISDEGIPMFDVVGRDEQSYYSTVIRQTVTLKPDQQGRVIYPYGTLQVKNGESKGQVEYIPSSGLQISNGFLNFALHVQPEKFEVERVEIPLNDPPYKPFVKKIYNVKTDQWETIDESGPVILGREDMGRYLTSSGQIILRFENGTDKRLILPIPYFLSEGQVKQSD